MTQPLRPMTLGEILDRTFQIYRSRFLVFAGIATIPVLILELIQAAENHFIHLSSLVHPQSRGEMMLWNFVLGLGYYHLSDLIALTLEPALIKLASASFLGERCSILSSLRFVALRWRGYLAVACTKLLAVLVAPEVLATGLALACLFAADIAGVMKGNSHWIGVLTLVLWVGLAIGLFLWAGACTSLAVPTAALESLRAFPSLRRSWALSKGTRARVCLTWLGVYISLWVLTFGLEFLLSRTMYFAGQSLHISATMRSLYAPAAFVLGTAIYALLAPIYPIAVTLFYYDQRIRLEGYDIERMMAAAGLNPTTLPTPDAPAADALSAPSSAPPAANPEGHA